MLEDDFTYVLSKALRGQALSLSEVAEKAHLSEEKVAAFLRGQFDAETAAHLANALNLSADAFSRHLNYHPKVVDLPYVKRLILPFREDHVNAWLVSKGKTHLLFDTGDTPSSAFIEMKRLGIEPTAILVTHGHPDHIAGLDAFSVPKYGPHIASATHLDPSETLSIGEITLHTIDLSGHFTPALGYVIDGLDRPLFVVGDAIFAGSIGGCMPSQYRNALRHIQKAITHLEDNTVILPGHGPATTVGEEKFSNPFLA